jgi:hypothetical protein
MYTVRGAVESVTTQVNKIGSTYLEYVTCDFELADMPACVPSDFIRLLVWVSFNPIAPIWLLLEISTRVNLKQYNMKNR